MNKPIVIGHQIVEGKVGAPVAFDVLKLILTRLLICANSGGGKSWILRRLAELLFPVMPVIIFDWEGEFATLREKFDFVLVGKGGETPADCRSAKLVMLKLMELRASAVIDLSELSLADKHRYVRLACEAAINSPKTLWQPTAFIFDEVHEVCPENGKGHSEAKQAVLGFPTKGRKRRFLSIFATQRLHKLALDARAEMLNRMIGMTFEPDDLNVAASILGIGKKEMDKFKHDMRTMEPGSFFAFGRAISLETILLKVGPVQTSHESETAKYGLNAPPPTAKIKALLPQLADLPQVAERELETEKELREEVARLNGEVQKVRSQSSVVSSKEPEIREVSVLTDADRKLLANAESSCGKLMDKFESEMAKIQDSISDMRRSFLPIREKAREVGGNVQTAYKRQPMPVNVRADVAKQKALLEPSGELTGTQQKILDTVAMLGVRGLTPNRDMIARWLSIHPNGGRYGSDLAALRAAGLLNGCELTSAGVQAASSGASGLDALCAVLEGTQVNIVRVLEHGDEMDRDTLAAELGIHPNGGRYGSDLARLRTMGVLPERGTIKLLGAATR